MQACWIALFLLLFSQLALADDAGDSFTDNLLTDLAPILALFGEQVTKQFLSQTFTSWDCIIFAVCPIGLITAIVSAIRVAAPNSWKAIVGRARESDALAELELLSSTSPEVCELWNGHAIIRVMGMPQILEVIYIDDLGDIEELKPLQALAANDSTWKLYTRGRMDKAVCGHSNTEEISVSLEPGKWGHAVFMKSY
jgi:hypothetical protein